MTTSGTGGTITVGDVTIPVQSWEMVADDDRDEEDRTLRGDPDAPDMPGLLASGAIAGTFSTTWFPPRPGPFVARSRRRVDGAWVTTKTY